MKATIEFNLPKESREHKLAIHAEDIAGFLWSLQNREIHNWLEYNEFETPEEALLAVNEQINEELSARGINLEDLIL